jgi:hypothetical protein
MGHLGFSRRLFLANVNAAGSVAISGSSPPPPPSGWTVNGGSITLQPSGSFDVASTGPANYAAGGVYAIDPSGTQLPAEITLNQSGLLAASNAPTQQLNNVVFRYHEPGGLPTLTLHPNITGTLPYMATAYPAEGHVPSGAILVSPDDTTLRSSVLSTWPDGSAQVVVLAGSRAVTSGVTQQIRLRPGLPSGPVLTPAFLAGLFTANAIQVNFGTLLTLTSTQLANNYDRIWWQNPAVICCRYRLPITNRSPMEAVIDVHAFAGGRAFVEVVIENCRMSTASPVAPTAQSYTNATVSVNGSVIRTQSSTWPGGSTHQPFRSWYCSGWVGGDPGIRVTHDTASLMAHPAFFRNEKTSAFNFDSTVPEGGFYTTSQVSQTYGTDTYVPWAFGRHLWNGMGQTGGSSPIGHFPQWEARYVQTGNKNVANAVIQSALALMSFPVNYRDSSTNQPPTFAQLSGKSFGGGFPKTGSIPFSNYTPYEWDYAHSPAVGLMAFLCRPSPCFIELSQSVAAFQGMAYSDQLFRLYFETRARAWCFRNLAQATFLTPDGDAWKTSAKTNMAANVARFRTWETDPEQRLNVHFSYEPGWYRDDGAGSNPATFGMALWMHHWLAVESNKAAWLKLLPTSDQAQLDAFADWCLAQPVRFINESAAGEWRYCGAYNHNIGTQNGNPANEGRATSIGMPSSWAGARALTKVESPPALSGQLYNLGTEEFTTYSVGWTSTHTPGNYSSMFMAALVAAVERGVSGAETAWSTFTTNVTNLAAFRDLAAQDARHNTWPRNK